MLKDDEIMPESRVKELAQEMKIHYGIENVRSEITSLEDIERRLGQKGVNAFYSHSENLAKAPRNYPSLIFHELGHAIIENKTRFLKFLQRNSQFGKRAIAMDMVSCSNS